MANMFRTIGAMALVSFQVAAFTAGVNAEHSPQFSDYRLVDSELKVVGIDSDPTESFLALELDSAGRLFAGGREALYLPVRQALLFPKRIDRAGMPVEYTLVQRADPQVGFSTRERRNI